MCPGSSVRDLEYPRPLLCGAARGQEEGMAIKASESTGLRNRSENLSLSGVRVCGKRLSRAPCPPRAGAGLSCLPAESDAMGCNEGAGLTAPVPVISCRV